MSQFSIDIAKFAVKCKLTVDQAARGIKISLFNAVIRDTRVDTGRLRGNWQTTTGSPELTEIDRKDKIENGQDGGLAQAEVVATVRGDTVDYLTNNVPYAEIWEEKDGMVKRNMARLDRILREVAGVLK